MTNCSSSITCHYFPIFRTVPNYILWQRHKDMNNLPMCYTAVPDRLLNPWSSNHKSNNILSVATMIECICKRFTIHKMTLNTFDAKQTSKQTPHINTHVSSWMFVRRQLVYCAWRMACQWPSGTERHSRQWRHGRCNNKCQLSFQQKNNKPQRNSTQYDTIQFSDL